MTLSFIPGDLHLSQGVDGSYVLTHKGEEIYRTASTKSALRRFNQMRTHLAAQFPKAKMSPEEGAAALKREIADKLVGHNSLRPRRKKIASTRTFG
jgi:hypothetical protein